MPQDAKQTKEQIVNFLKRHGPSLPVHIAKNANMTMIFTSAFLSELISDKEIRMSYMRIGSSPVYFIPGQEASLEKFSEHLKSKEKDAYLLLRERKFLEDIKQDPAIRLALRAIKDFAIPLESQDQLYWRYFTTDPSEFTIPKETPKIEPAVEIKEEKVSEIDGPIIEILESTEIPQVKEEFSKIEEEIHTKKKAKSEHKPKKSTKKKPIKKDDKFFEKIKSHLEKKGIEITGIEGVEKSELILRVKEGKTEKILFAFKKKKITDSDLMKAFKKASDLEMPYKILSLGETPKKLSGLIEAAKSLENMEKVE